MRHRVERLRAATGRAADELFDRLTRRIAKRRAESIRTPRGGTGGWFAEPLEQRLLFSLPPWVSAADSAASWNASSDTLTVTGAATITSDPGTSTEPIVDVTGSSAYLTINPGDDIFVHLGGLSLTDGAAATLSSIPGGATEQNHNVLVIGQVNATAAPLFTIDSTSKLDLADNDLIIHDGNLSAVQTDLEEGRAPASGAPGGDADGTWSGGIGITSSVAAALDSAAHTEKYVLGAGLSSDLSGDPTEWSVGPASEQLSGDGNDVLVKYNLNGDFNLDGTVNRADTNIVRSDQGLTNADFFLGDANGDGGVNAVDRTIAGQFVGSSVPSSPASPSALTAVLDATNPRAQIDLSWQPPATQPDHYIVEQSTNGTNFTDLPTTIAGNLTSYDVSGLPSSTEYWFRIRAVYSSGTPSVAVASSSITTASAAPGVTVLSAVWDYQDDPNKLILTFDQNVNIAPDALQFENATNGTELTPADYALIYDSTAHAATYTFPDQTSGLGVSGVLPDGWWIATIDKNDVTSVDGSSHLNQDCVVNCPTLTGDANHAVSTNAAGQEQLIVGSDDYSIVLDNLGAANVGYAQGSLDYSGEVGLGDLSAMEANYGAVLTAPPSTPSQLVISNDAGDPQTTLDVDWSTPASIPAGSTISAYQLQRSADGESFTTLAAGIDPSTTNFTDTTLSPGTRYWYRVRALYSNGSASVYSAKTALDTLLAPPTATVSTDGKRIALASQSAGGLDAAALTYTWAAQSIPPGAPAPTFTDNSTPTALSTTATVGAVGNYTFEVTITAPGGVVVSVASVPVTVSQVPTLAISPANATVALGDDQQFFASETDQFGASMGTVQPIWSLDSTDDGAISPSGLYTASTDTLGNQTVTAALGSLTASATLTVSSVPDIANAGFESPALAAGSFQYNPTDAGWTFAPYSGISSNASGFTNGNPNAPEGDQVGVLQFNSTISQSVGGWAAGAYTLSFSAAQRVNYGGHNQNFQVLIDGDPVGTFDPASTNYATFTTSTFTVTAGTHTIEFIGLDTAGGDNTAFLDDVTLAAVSGPVVPPAPTSLSATVASPTEIDLSWTGAAGATGYTVEMDDGDGSGMQPIGSVDGSTTTYQVTGLNVNSAYSFCVLATNANGTSTPSNTATASTPDPVPRNLQANAVSATEIDLSWTSNFTGEDGFAIEEQQNDGSWQQVDEVAGGGYTDAITGLAEGTAYTFEVEAIYGNSQSSPSDPASATTDLAAPTDASATAPQPDQANIDWTDNSSDEEGFDLTYTNETTDASDTVVVPPNGAGGPTGYALTGLTPDTNYDLSITAYKGSVQSDPATASFTTLPVTDAPVYTWSNGQGPLYEGNNTTTLTISNLPANTNATITLNPDFEGSWDGTRTGTAPGDTQPDAPVGPDYWGASGPGVDLYGAYSAFSASATTLPPQRTFTFNTGSGTVSYTFTSDTVTSQGYLPQNDEWWNISASVTLPPTLPTVSIDPVADPGLLTQPAGDSIDQAFTISRTMPSGEDDSTPLTVNLNPWLGTAIQGSGKDYTLAFSPSDPSDTASSVTIPAGSSSVTVMAQLLSTEAFYPTGTIWGLLQASSDYLLADSVAGPATTAVPPESADVLVGATKPTDTSLNDDWVAAQDATGNTETIDDYVVLHGTAGTNVAYTISSKSASGGGTISLAEVNPDGSPKAFGATITDTATIGADGTVNFPFYIQGGHVSAKTEDVEVDVKDGERTLGSQTLTVIQFTPEPETMGKSFVPVNPVAVSASAGANKGNVFGADVVPDSGAPGIYDPHSSDVPFVFPNLNNSTKINYAQIKVVWRRVFAGTTTLSTTGGSPLVAPADNGTFPAVRDNLRVQDTGITPAMEATGGTIDYYMGNPGDVLNNQLTVSNNYAAHVQSEVAPMTTYPVRVNVMQLVSAAGASLGNVALDAWAVTNIINKANQILSQASIQLTVPTVAAGTLLTNQQTQVPDWFDTDFPVGGGGMASLLKFYNDSQAINIFFVRSIDGGNTNGETIYPHMPFTTDPGVAIQAYTNTTGAGGITPGNDLARTLAHEMLHYLQEVGDDGHSKKPWNIFADGNTSITGKYRDIDTNELDLIQSVNLSTTVPGV